MSIYDTIETIEIKHGDGNDALEALRKEKAKRRPRVSAKARRATIVANLQEAMRRRQMRLEKQRQRDIMLDEE